MSTENNDKECVDLNKIEKRLLIEMDKIRKEVDDLYVTVYKGNGHPSLVTRINSVEGKLRGLREQMDEKISHLSKEHALKFDSIHQKLESKFGRLEGWIETKFTSMENMMKDIKQQNMNDTTGNWHYRAAVVTAIAAIFAAGLAYFFK